MPKSTQDVLHRVKTETVEIGNEVTMKISGFMVGGLSFVAGLAWNDAIKALIEYFFPLAKNTIVAQLLYAVLISVIVIIVSVFIVRASKKIVIEKDSEKKPE